MRLRVSECAIAVNGKRDWDFGLRRLPSLPMVRQARQQPAIASLAGTLPAHCRSIARLAAEELGPFDPAGLPGVGPLSSSGAPGGAGNKAIKGERHRQHPADDSVRPDDGG
jgi:hypothetical protein